MQARRTFERFLIASGLSVLQSGQVALFSLPNLSPSAHRVVEIIVSRRRFGVAESYRPSSWSARLARTLMFTDNTLVLLVLLVYIVFPQIGQEGKNFLRGFGKIW